MAIGSGSFIIRKQKNLPPVAIDDAYATNMGVQLNVIPVSNDFDQDDDLKELITGELDESFSQ